MISDLQNNVCKKYNLPSFKALKKRIWASLKCQVNYFVNFSIACDDSKGYFMHFITSRINSYVTVSGA